MQQNALVQEKQMWATKGATQNSDGIFQVNDKPVLPKSLFKAAAIVTHGPLPCVNRRDECYHTTTLYNLWIK